MLTDKEIASWLVRLYNGGGQFDFYEEGAGDSGICFGVLLRPDESVVLFRGSKSLKDWWRDFMAVTSPYAHKVYGPVHPGFATGMDRATFEISTKIDPAKPITIGGHSLGAGRAAIYTAMLLENYPHDASMLRRVVFGEPKPGFQQLADYIKDVPAVSYRNGDSHFHDLVTSVPATFPPEEYVHPVPLTEVCAPPTGNLMDKLSVFAWHHCPLYEKALS